MEPAVPTDAEEPLLRELERGVVVFGYRPRVDGQPGIQRFFMLLGAEDGGWRRVVVGKKRLPGPGSGEREWAYVDRVRARRDAMLEDLGPSTYVTKTRGERHQPGARLLAEGRYRIIEHGNHVHLAYELEDEDDDDEAAAERRALRDALGLRARGSVVAAVFNPLAKWSRQATLALGGDVDEDMPFREPSIYPDELQARFEDRRFAPLAPELLAYEGAELVLMGAQDHLPEERAA